MKKAVNILSADIEDRRHAPSRHAGSGDLSSPGGSEESIEQVLDIFGRFGVKATFFVSGAMAERIPDAVKEIHTRGHEIASHGYYHTPAYDLTEEEFEEDLVRSLDVLSAITGVRPAGYRAPYWSVTEKSLWALKILGRNGIKYDSSIYPTKNYLYGIPDFPRFPHYVEEFSIYEFPGSTVNVLGKNIPFGGGVYLRAMPAWLTKLCAGAVNKRGHPSLIYIHQHELGGEGYPVPFFHKENFILNFGRRSVEKKISFLLGSYNFITFEEYLRQYGYYQDRANRQS